MRRATEQVDQPGAFVIGERRGLTSLSPHAANVRSLALVARVGMTVQGETVEHGETQTLLVAERQDSVNQ